jgi:hypothetical protein
VQVEKSRFVSNSILGGLSGMVNLPIFDDMTFSRIQGPFSMEYPIYRTDGITFDNPLMNLRMTGAVGPGSQLDLVLRMELLQMAGGVPLVGEVLTLFNKLAGQIFNFKVRGTLDDPRVAPL